MTRLVFIHGWGFEAGFWAPLRTYLAPWRQDAIDLGFFGTPAVPPAPEEDAIIAVTHSYGTQWLLETQPFAWHTLIAINGFPRFSEAPDFTPATPRRTLDRMLHRLEQDPAAVVAAFRRRCGATAPLPPGLDVTRLRAGLLDLRDGDGRPGLRADRFRLLALAGRDDAIVPPAMSAHAFAALPGATLDWHPTGGHLLPATAPEWCARRIAAFIGCP